MEVAPINVVSNDEIGQVARAFDQVHAEAVRLASEQALLRAWQSDLGRLAAGPPRIPHSGGARR
jgi:hypothetical protein